MTPLSPKSIKPITLTIDDQIETRAYTAKQSMRWPVDEETRRSLALITHERVPLRRRVLRWWTRRVARWGF